MKRLSVILLTIVLYNYIILNTSIYAGETSYELKPLVITPYKTPVSAYQSNRSTSVIAQDELSNHAYTSIPKILSHTPGVDMRRRGGFGVQADVSIRGANFEENLIMIDGVRVNDPQTGHHNMDIPFTLYDIERIEVVKGHTSGVYGADGFGGAVNIITKKPTGFSAKAATSYGENDFFANIASVTFPLMKLNNRVSFENKRSDGWRDYTDFDITTLSYFSSLDFEKSNLNFQFGWKDNDFGADSFYSNLYPREEEHTDTRFFKLDGVFKPHQFRIEPKFYYRRHADKFILDSERRGWYENFHTSYVYGAEVLMHVDSYFGRYTVGAEIANDKLESGNLGFHSHQREAVLLALSPKITDRITSNASIRYDHFYKWGNEWSPSVDIGYMVTESFNLHSSVGRSYRTPSFTELYYVSSGNIGDDSLMPQSSWSYEAGVNFKERGAAIQCDIFRRDAENVIDWTRTGSGQPWQAKNIGELTTDGIEAMISFAPVELEEDYPLKLIRFSYGHLDSDREGAEDLKSKYALVFLRDHANMHLEGRLPFGFDAAVDLSFKDRVDHDGHFLLDAKLYKDITYKKFKARLFVEGANLFNTFYTEVEDITPPGRWVIAGIEAEF